MELAYIAQLIDIGIYRIEIFRQRALRDKVCLHCVEYRVIALFRGLCSPLFTFYLILWHILIMAAAAFAKKQLRFESKIIRQLTVHFFQKEIICIFSESLCRNKSRCYRTWTCLTLIGRIISDNGNISGDIDASGCQSLA